MGNNIEAAQALVAYQQQYGELVHEITGIPPRGFLRRIRHEVHNTLRHQLPRFYDSTNRFDRLDKVSELVGNVFVGEENRRVREGFNTGLSAHHIVRYHVRAALERFEASNHDEAQVYAAEHNLDAEKVQRLFTASHAAGIAIAGLFLGMGRHKPRLEDDFLAVVESVSQARDDAFAI